MALPDKLKSRMKGKIVRKVEDFTSSGMSLVGSHTLVLTDHPAAYVHDTGGLLGEEKVLALERKELAKKSKAYWHACSSNLMAELDFGGGAKIECNLGRATGSAEKVFCKAIGTDPAADFDYPLGVSVKFVFSGSDKLEGLSAEEIALKLKNMALAIGGQPGEEESLAAAAALWALASGNSSFRVKLSGGRFQLVDSEGKKYVDVPIGSFEFSREDLENVVRVTGSTVVGEIEVDEFQIFFPNKDLAESLSQAVAKSRRETSAVGRMAAREEGTQKGLMSTAKISGILSGGKLRGIQMDVVLGQSSLALLDKASSQTVHTFDFAAPETSIQGSGQSFVVFDRKAGPLEVSLESQTFGLRMETNRAVNSCAVRAARDGPFLGKLGDGCPVVAFVRDGALTFEGIRAPKPLDLGGTCEVVPEISEEESRLTIRATKTSVGVSAEPAMLDGLASRISAESLLLEGESKLLQELERLSELEEDYILLAALGAFAQTHTLLKTVLSDDADSLSPLAEPSGPDEEIKALTTFAFAVEYLRGCVDAAVYYLPGHIVEQDSRLMEEAGVDVGTKLRTRERVYASAFSVLAATGARLGRIEQEAKRNEQVRANLARAAAGTPGAGALALGGGLSALLGNPLPFILASARFLGGLSSSEEREGAAAETQKQSSVLAVGQWNYIMTSLLPPLISRVMGPIRTERGTISKTLGNHIRRVEGEARERALRALALRLGRLKNLPIFPQSKGEEPRGRAIGMLKELAKVPSGQSFPAF